MRTIQANPFARQWADTEEAVLAAVRRVGQSAYYILGKEVEAFEAALAAYQGAHFAVGCASGLDAIELGLRALGLAPGDKVLTTPLSAFATTLAIVRAGGRPVFVDVDRSGLLDLELASEALECDRSLRFMVPVHLFGFSLDLERLRRLKSRFELRIVEDCAQAIGAGHGAANVGSAGDIATYSFYPTKNLGALGDGGAISTDDAALRDKIRSLRDYGQTTKYVHDELGMNSRLDELHAAILHNAYLPKLTAWTQRRRELARRYAAGIANPHVSLVPAPAESRSVFHLFPVRVAASARDAFMAHLRAAGVQVGVHYPKLICDQHALVASAPEAAYAEVPRARALAAEEVSLPIHPYLADDEIDYTIEAINGWQP